MGNPKPLKNWWRKDLGEVLGDLMGDWVGDKVGDVQGESWATLHQLKAVVPPMTSPPTPPRIPGLTNNKYKVTSNLIENNQ